MAPVHRPAAARHIGCCILSSCAAAARHSNNGSQPAPVRTRCSVSARRSAYSATRQPPKPACTRALLVAPAALTAACACACCRLPAARARCAIAATASTRAQRTACCSAFGYGDGYTVRLRRVRTRVRDSAHSARLSLYALPLLCDELAVVWRAQLQLACWRCAGPQLHAAGQRADFWCFFGSV